MMARLDAALLRATPAARELMLVALLLPASLSSWYSYRLGVTVPPLVSFVFTVALTGWVMRREGMRTLELLAACVLALTLGMVLLAQLVAGELPFSAARLAGVLTCVATLPMAACLLRSNYLSGVRPARVLALVIGVHVSAIGVQLLYFLFTRQYLDFLFDLTGEWQRVYSSKGLNVGIYRLPRFAGLFNEPGTYSGAMLPLFFLYRLLRGRIDTLYAAALCSVVLTMSAFGLVGVLLCVAWEAVTQMSRRTLSISLLGIVLATVLAATVLVPAYESRFAGDAGSLSLRAGGLAAFAALDYREFLLGRGATADTVACPECIGLYMGTGVTWIYYFGLIGFIAVFLLAPLLPYLGRPGRRGIFTFLFVVLLLSAMKIKYVYPWLGWLLALGAFICMTSLPPRHAGRFRWRRSATTPWRASRHGMAAGEGVPLAPGARSRTGDTA